MISIQKRKRKIRHMERRLAMLRSRTFVSENKLKLLSTALCVVAGLAVFLQVVMCDVSIIYDVIPNLVFARTISML